MTNAEAIAILKTYDVNFYNDDGHKIRADKICEALDMAIQALEQINKITALLDGTIDHFDRDDAIDLLYEIKEVIK